MSLVATLKAKLGIVDKDLEAAFQAIEPEVQKIAKSEVSVALAGLVAELPTLTTALTAAMIGSGVSVASATAVTGVISQFFTNAVAKVTAAPVVPVSPTAIAGTTAAPSPPPGTVPAATPPAASKTP